jgi:dihydroorotate dehydrogenase
LNGLTFQNPFGVAAGFDKNATVYHALTGLVSPGFIELGAVTQRPQDGNPRPRIVRIRREGLINSMGFPNDGVIVIANRLERMGSPGIPLGMNLGKMRDTSDANAPQEYAELIRAFAPIQRSLSLPDYYVVNVSSPNTPGLTALQDIQPLTRILEAVTEELDVQSSGEVSLRKRLLIKLSPDLPASSAESIVELVLQFDIGGLIEGNTTVNRPIPSRYNDRPGGFSGSALYDRTSGMVRYIASLLPHNKVLIATGGVDSVERAYEMLQYADLVAGYTGLVLKGFGLFRRLGDGVLELMKKDGVESLSELRQGQRPP